MHSCSAKPAALVWAIRSGKCFLFQRRALATPKSTRFRILTALPEVYFTSKLLSGGLAASRPEGGRGGGNGGVAPGAAAGTVCLNSLRFIIARRFPHWETYKRHVFRIKKIALFPFSLLNGRENHRSDYPGLATKVLAFVNGISILLC